MLPNLGNVLLTLGLNAVIGVSWDKNKNVVSGSWVLKKDVGTVLLRSWMCTIEQDVVTVLLQMWKCGNGAEDSSLVGAVIRTPAWPFFKYYSKIILIFFV